MRNRMFELIYLPSKSDVLGGNGGDISSSWTGGTEPRATEGNNTRSILFLLNMFQIRLTVHKVTHKEKHQ